MDNGKCVIYDVDLETSELVNLYQSSPFHITIDGVGLVVTGRIDRHHVFPFDDGESQVVFDVQKG